MSWFTRRRDRASDRFWAEKIDIVFESAGKTALCSRSRTRYNH
jgi:hypothetical protein